MNKIKIITLKDLKKIGKINHMNLIWKAIMEMDCVFLDDLLVENIIYKNLDKYIISKKEFITDLYSLFDIHVARGDREFFLSFDICKSYNSKEPVCKFIGNESENSFSLHFEAKGQRITKIHQCFKLMNYDDCPF